LIDKRNDKAIINSHT